MPAQPALGVRVLHEVVHPWLKAEKGETLEFLEPLSPARLFVPIGMETYAVHHVEGSS